MLSWLNSPGVVRVAALSIEAIGMAALVIIARRADKRERDREQEQQREHRDSDDTDLLQAA